MEYLAIIPAVLGLSLMGVIFYMGFTSKGRSKIMKRQIDLMQDMTTRDMGKKMKDLSSTVINVRKDILKENENTLKDISQMEANIQKEAIKIKAKAVKEGFDSTNVMFCKHCGKTIDDDSSFCKHCGKQQ